MECFTKEEDPKQGLKSRQMENKACLYRKKKEG